MTVIDDRLIAKSRLLAIFRSARPPMSLHFRALKIANKTTMPPELLTDFYRIHTRLLCFSYSHWTGRQLLHTPLPSTEVTEILFHAPFALVSHGTEDDPIFNFGNQMALELFEMSWTDFTNLPSRKSAEPVNRLERSQLLARVTANGFIDDYRGVRISSSGKRFLIDNATVWNIVDDDGGFRGQAARFEEWMFVQSEG